MIKLDKRCSTCKRITQEKQKGKQLFLTRLYNSRAYGGEESLSNIAKEVCTQEPFKCAYKTAYQSITRHCKYHQAISEDDLINNQVVRAAKRKDDEVVRKIVQHRDVRQMIMDKGVEQIESGELQLTAAAVVTAANKEADIELKQKDQQLKLMEMVAMFQSGEVQRKIDNGPSS